MLALCELLLFCRSLSAVVNKNLIGFKPILEFYNNPELHNLGFYKFNRIEVSVNDVPSLSNHIAMK